MCAAACLHADDTWRQVAEIGGHLIALELLTPQWLTAFVGTVDLKDTLCQIDRDCRNLHSGRSFRSSGCTHSHFGTLMPFQVGASIPLISADAAGEYRLHLTTNAFAVVRQQRRSMCTPSQYFITRSCIHHTSRLHHHNRVK